ncbi:MAG TPA: dTDP-4-dehydrorhamnose 3,5-epimerase [Blastocatellia bacterium]|nr:dTDP-4-dehydrorhamnose 3,5-epimerase [Blastocatellia bacterium]
MKRIETALTGICLIEPEVFSDERGFFFESYSEKKFAAIGISDHFVQDNHARSVKGTLRGLHYQINRPQAKLCRVIQGEVLDVAVDIRRGSPQFGQYVAVKLSAEDKLQIYIPAGFAHGYLVLSERAEFVYKCSDFYYPEFDRGIIWNDADIAIPWGIDEPLLSAKDRSLPRLASVPTRDLPEFHP